MIISQSKDSFEGEVLVGVFDDNSFTLIGFFVFVMIGFIWIAIQLEKYNNLTPEQPTLMQVKPSVSMTDYVISMGLAFSLHAQDKTKCLSTILTSLSNASL